MGSFVRLHPRLIAAVLIGIVAFFVTRPGRSAVAAGILAWNAGCWC